MRTVLLSSLLLFSACRKDEVDPAEPLYAVPADRTWDLPSLSGPAHIVYTEGGVPHIYAANRRDLAVVWGFQMARDRFFIMDLSRRLALGELSEVLGRDALETDMESRAEGNRHIAEQMLAMTEQHHPELTEILDGYAEGVNAYIDAVKRGDLPGPSEYDLAAGTLGEDDPANLLAPYDRLDVIAGAATVIAQSGFEGGDVGRGRSAALLEDWIDGGMPFAALRQDALTADVWDRVEPVFDVASAPDWSPASHPRERARAPRSAAFSVPDAPVDRILTRRARWDRWRGHDWEHGWGSNAWAVGGAHTTDGRALLAGDGHLALTIPPLFYQIGLDTSLLGETDDLAFMGMAIPGVPVPGPGTNGHIAWSQIAFFGDVTDWYREELQLDDEGRPAATRFQGTWEPVTGVDETYVVREVPALGSEGGTERWTRWTTFDGRWIADIEGNAVDPDHDPGPGRAVLAMGGDFIVPEDLDGDGVITAISFDYAPLDGSPALNGLWGFAEARDVDAFHDAARDLVGNAAGLVAADVNGDILYTGFQAVPCRSYLPRNGDGSFVGGADPTLLIDGTQYPGFTIPLTDGHVDLSHGDDPQRCVVPFEDYPFSRNPGQGFLVAANNDPGGQTFDNDLTNDGYYVGGPWLEGYRADTIARELEGMVQDGRADLTNMQVLQGNHDSRLGEQFVPPLLAALDRAQALADGSPDDPSEARMAATWTANAARFTEVRGRLSAWADRGFQARSGVETFYEPVQPDDADDSVATMIFNAWYGRFLGAVLSDEGFPGSTFRPTGDSGRQRLMKRIHLLGRGADNPQGLAGFNPETGESVYFDDARTAEVETSDELQLLALEAALDFLTGPESDDGMGGFGTDDMDTWRWGYRHWVRFDSVLAEFLGDDPSFTALTSGFSISPRRFPVADGIAPNDPRRDLPGFPRHGDHLNVDAGNSGTSGTRFSYGSGPVFRMAVALGPDGVEGVNVLPGGQSGLSDNPHFDDQAKRWLGNDVLPMHTTVEQVVAAAVSREAFRPGTMEE